MTCVLLAVANSPLAIFHTSRQRIEVKPTNGTSFGKPVGKACQFSRAHSQRRSSARATWGVRGDHRMTAWHAKWAAIQMPLGRVEIPARRINTVRPTHVPILLPGREGHAVIEELRDAPQMKVRRRRKPLHTDRSVEGKAAGRNMIQTNDRISFVSPSEKDRAASPRPFGAVRA